MNIFILDENPKLAANLLDKHIVKMPLETAQILCTVANLKGFSSPYKSTHIKHPVVQWVFKSSANWNWLCEHGIALCVEYTKRYNKIHACEKIIKEMQLKTFDIWKDNKHYSEHTVFVQCMPDQYKKANPIDGYRSYYIGEKKEFATWKFPGIKPDWFV